MPITRRGPAAMAALLLWLAACAVPALAESKAQPYALIFGTVWGPDARPVYGVHVKLRRASEKKFRWEAMSDHRGEFGIRVPAAKQDYILVPDVKLPKGETVRETAVHIEYDERVDLGIHLDEE